MRSAAIMLAVMAVAGCSKSNCEQGVHRVFDLASNPAPQDKDSAPSAQEQAVIDMVAKQATAVCEREGLSDAQLACLLAMHTLKDFETVVDCPAIAAHKPSWLIAGHPPPIPPAP